MLQFNFSPTVDDIFSLEKNCFAVDYWNKEQIESHLKANKSFLIFEKPNIFLGYILYLELQDEIEILKIGTMENSRRKGIASSMIHYFEKSKKSIFLEVKITNIEAIEFYKKNGFQNIGTRKKYYANGEDAIMMKKEGIS